MYAKVVQGVIAAYGTRAASPLPTCIAMADRRCEKRFNVTVPANGVLRICPDVIVHEDAEGKWVGISRQPATAGEAFILTVAPFDGLGGELPRRVAVRVIESRPIMVDGRMHHHIRLHSEVPALIQFEQQLCLMTGELDVPPVLTKESSVLVVDVSTGGCLLESRRWIEVGTNATLQLQFGTEACKDDVEVVRCEMLASAPALYRLGVRLLRTRPRQPGTIRHAVARYLTEQDRPAIDRVM